MYKIEYKKNYSDKKPILGTIRFHDKSESTKTVAYLKSCTKKNPKPDAFNGGDFWISDLIINGRKTKV